MVRAATDAESCRRRCELEVSYVHSPNQDVLYCTCIEVVFICLRSIMDWVFDEKCRDTVQSFVNLSKVSVFPGCVNKVVSNALMCCLSESDKTD